MVLYEGLADCGRIGLIVTQATAYDVPTAQGACTGADAEPAQRVNPIEPIHSEQGKIRVQTPGRDAETMLLQLADLQPL